MSGWLPLDRRRVPSRYCRQRSRPRASAAEPAGLSRHALRELRAAVRGPVSSPRGSAALVYNTRFDGRRPDAVVHVRDTADVAAAVRWANRFDVPLVARSGGHSYGGYSTTTDGVVLDLSALHGVRVSGGRATVGPAARLIDVQRALTRRGVTVPSGSCPTVGIGGLALGGGHGLAGRRFGLTSDNLVAARVVTADGRVRHVDASTNEDLYWALPGRRRRQLRRGHLADAADAPRLARRVLLRVLAVVPGERGDRGVAAVRAARAAARSRRSCRSARPAARARRGCPRSASTSAARRRCGGWSGRSPRVAGASLSTGTSSYFTMVLRWAGCLDGGLSACHRSTRSSFYAKSDYFDTPVGPRGRARMIDWIERRQRTPSLGSGALLLDAYGGALNRPAAGRDRVRAPRHAVLAPVPGLLRRRRGRAGEQALDQRRLARAAPARVGRGVPELHRPGPRPLAARLLRREPRAACATSRSRSTPTSGSASRRRSRRRADGPRLAQAAARAARLPPVRLGGDARARLRRDVLGRASSCSCSTAPAAPALPARRWPRSPSRAS